MASTASQQGSSGQQPVPEVGVSAMALATVGQDQLLIVKLDQSLPGGTQSVRLVRHKSDGSGTYDCICNNVIIL